MSTLVEFVGHLEIHAGVLKCTCGTETLLADVTRGGQLLGDLVGHPENACPACGRVWWVPATVDLERADPVRVEPVTQTQPSVPRAHAEAADALVRKDGLLIAAVGPYVAESWDATSTARVVLDSARLLVPLAEASGVDVELLRYPHRAIVRSMGTVPLIVVVVSGHPLQKSLQRLLRQTQRRVHTPAKEGMSGIVNLPKGTAKCPECGKRCRVYKDEKGWRAHAHGRAQACIGPYHYPRISEQDVTQDEHNEP